MGGGRKAKGAEESRRQGLWQGLLRFSRIFRLALACKAPSAVAPAIDILLSMGNIKKCTSYYNMTTSRVVRVSMMVMTESQ